MPFETPPKRAPTPTLLISICMLAQISTGSLDAYGAIPPHDAAADNPKSAATPMRLAEGDNFYEFEYDGGYEDEQQYRINSEGASTNIRPEYHPTERGWSTEYRREWVQTPGARTGLEDTSTGIQLDFRF